jgi:streptogramin lyase
MQMQATKSAILNSGYLGATVLAALLAWVWFQPFESRAADDSLLSGKVTAAGQPQAGIPVRAQRDGSNITVTVYSNSRGEYAFPAWSAVSPGSYTVSVQLPDFEPLQRTGVALATGKTAPVDLALRSRQPQFADANASEIATALPGTDEERFLLTQCSNCHSLQWALHAGRSQEDWLRVIKKMAGEQSPSTLATGSSYFGNERYREKFSSYLASIRGPGSSDPIPFKLRPRPTSDAATRLVVTEYDLPRGGAYEQFMFRGDQRFVWPHDSVMNAQYLYYTDHYHPVLGRLDKKTGAIKEFTYTPANQRPVLAPGQERAGFAEGRGPTGTRDLAFDPQGNVLIEGLRFDTKTEQFALWTPAKDLFGVAPDGKIWSFENNSGTLHVFDSKTGAEEKTYKIPPIPRSMIMYDSWIDAKGRPIMLLLGEGKVGVFDPKTEKYAAYPVPTARSGPRRGDPDAQGRSWYGLYWSGRLGMFDPDKTEMKEFPLVPDSKNFGPPFAAPYTASVDDRNQLVWANDFNTHRLYSFDMKSEKTTEFFMPLPYEVRDLTVDRTADRPTVWIPSYRPPAKMVKVEIY